MRAVVAFIRLGRPLFLGGAFLLFALGAAIAAWHGHGIDWQRYVLGQLPIGIALGLPTRVALASAIPVPIALWRIVRVADHRDPTAFERLTFFAVLLLVATTTAELVAFAL